MFKIYRLDRHNIQQSAERLIAREAGIDCIIKKTDNGKPYIEGNPVYFSITHSSYFAFIAISDKPVGADYEIYRERKISAVLSRFTQREKDDIAGSTDNFLKNWVAKEAYIKLIGGTLAHDLKRLEFYDGKLYFDGEEKPVYFEYFFDGIFAYCIEE